MENLALMLVHSAKIAQQENLVLTVALVLLRAKTALMVNLVVLVKFANFVRKVMNMLVLHRVMFVILVIIKTKILPMRNARHVLLTRTKPMIEKKLLITLAKTSVFPVLPEGLLLQVNDLVQPAPLDSTNTLKMK